MERQMKKETEARITKPVTVCLIAALCCFLWGSAFPCVKISYEMFAIAGSDSFSQILFAGIRFFLAGILIIVFNLAAGRLLVPKKESAVPIIKLSMVQTVLQYLFFYIGLANTSGVKASIIEASNVFFAIMIPTLVLKKEKMTFQKAAGCLIGFLGVVLINLRGNSIDAGFRFNGEFFLLISALMYAVSSVMVKEYSSNENPVTLSAYQFLIGGAVMIAAGLAGKGTVHPSSPAAFMMLVYLAFISATAYSLWSVLLKYNPVSTVAVYGFLNPVFGVFLSAVLLGESRIFSLFSLLCLILVSSGIYMVNRPSRK